MDFCSSGDVLYSKLSSDKNNKTLQDTANHCKVLKLAAALYRGIVFRAVEPDFKKSNNKPDAKVGYRRLYPTLHSKGCC